MPTEKEVYRSHSEEYEALILCEDYQGNIPEEIARIRDPQDLTIVELGAGTGRLTRGLAGTAGRIFASDLSPHMLSKAAQVLTAKESRNYQLSVADMRQIPLPENFADMVIAGWSFCYLAVWSGETWKFQVDEGIAEAKRLLKPGGVVILLESLGTGTGEPDPPPHLKAYLVYLSECGFQSRWFRTDYQFSSIDEAARISSFFFGEEMAGQIRDHGWHILPECTAIFWLRI